MSDGRFAAATRLSRGDISFDNYTTNTAQYSSTTVRRTRSSVASTVGSVNGDEEPTNDLPPSLLRSSLKGKGKGKAPISRASMSSISTANDYATSSGYSTPATSAVTTPAVLPNKESVSRSAPDIFLHLPVQPSSLVRSLHVPKPLHLFSSLPLSYLRPNWLPNL